MKKITTLALLFIGIMAYSQCSILGKSVIGLNETVEFGIANAEAQCSECNHWQLNNTNATIEGSTKMNQIRVTGKALGNNVISLSILTDKGFVQCIKPIQIASIPVPGEEYKATSPTYLEIKGDASKCSIDVTNIEQVKINDNTVSTFTKVQNDQYKYSWVVTYANGEVVETKSIVPQFNFDNELHAIKSVRVRIQSSDCSKEIVKTYEENFWKFF